MIGHSTTTSQENTTHLSSVIDLSKQKVNGQVSQHINVPVTKPDHAAIPPLRDGCASDSILARDTTARLVSGHTGPSTELWYFSWNNLTSCIAYPDLLFMSQKMCSVPSQKLKIYSKLSVIFLYL